jgi:hypothetical protein
MKIRMNMIIAILITFCFTASIFMAIPTRNQSTTKTYNPLADINQDGKVSLQDLVLLALAYGTNGTPINTTELENQVTNLQNQNNQLQAWLEGNETLLNQSARAPYSYIISTDGTNYYCTNGTTGLIDWSSTNPSSVFTNTFGNISASTGGGSVYCKNGKYNTCISVPANVTFVVEGNGSGITYSSIGDGAKIVSSEWTAAWGGYCEGDVTVQGNSSNPSIACYAFFKPDNTVWAFGTSLVYALQMAQNNLTSGGDIYLVTHGNLGASWDGRFNITNGGVSFHSDSVYFGTTPSVLAVAHLDKSMIYVSGSKCHLYNLALDGNSANQDAGKWDGIDIVSGAIGQDMHMTDCYWSHDKGNGIQFGVYSSAGPQSGNSVFSNVYVEYSGLAGWNITAPTSSFVACSCWGNLASPAEGFYINNTYADKFTNCHVLQCNALGIWNVTNCVALTFTSCDSNGSISTRDSGWFCLNDNDSQWIGCGSSGNAYTGFGFQTCNRIIVDSCISNSNGRYGFWLQGTSNSTFVGDKSFNDSQSAANTYDAFRIGDDGLGHYSTFNQFSACSAEGTSAQMMHDGFNELASSDSSNTYVECNSWNAATFNIINASSTSHVDLCWNGTTWCP